MEADGGKRDDNSLARMPGVRDRVARVRLNEDEGGMNLNLEAGLISDIAKSRPPRNSCSDSR